MEEINVDIEVSRIKSKVWNLEQEKKELIDQINYITKYQKERDEAIIRLSKLNTILFIGSFFLSFYIFWSIL